jgi:NADH-quinone oxidoreductase subunit L
VTAQPAAGEHAAAAEPVQLKPDATAESESAGVEHGLSTAGELGLMLFSVLVAAAGILVARHFYLARPELPVRLAERWRGAHTLLFHKYYVDELYDATAIKGTMASSRGLWQFDMEVVDGAVNGTGWLTRTSSWLSHMFDKYVVDGLVNFVGWTAGEGSLIVRRVQTGLVQNYALLMVVGVFMLLTFFLIAR